MRGECGGGSITACIAWGLLRSLSEVFAKLPEAYEERVEVWSIDLCFAWGLLRSLAEVIAKLQEAMRNAQQEAEQLEVGEGNGAVEEEEEQGNEDVDMAQVEEEVEGAAPAVPAGTDPQEPVSDDGAACGFPAPPQAQPSTSAYQ